MLEALKEETIVNKVGGRFRLSALIQKRLTMLNHGSPPLVEAEGLTAMEIVLREIATDKILMGESGEVERVENEDEAEDEIAGTIEPAGE